MDFNKIIKRVMDLITNPVEAMQGIKNEPATIQDLYLNYAVILAAIPAVASLLGWFIIGAGLQFGLVLAISTYLLSLAGTALFGIAVDFLAPNFGSQKDMVASFKVAIYTMTASWVAGVILILPRLSFIMMIASLYGIYLAYLGLIHIKNTPEDKVVGYLIVSIVIAGIIIYAMNYIAMRIAFGNAYSLASMMIR